MLHLRSSLTPKTTVCLVDTRDVSFTIDDESFIEFAKESPEMVCADCVHDGLHEEIIDEIYDSASGYKDMEGVIG